MEVEECSDNKYTNTFYGLDYALLELVLAEFQSHGNGRFASGCVDGQALNDVVRLGICFE